MASFDILGDEFMVTVVAFADDREVRALGPFRQAAAEKTERGVLVNLDHDRFYTVIRKATEAERLAKRKPPRVFL